MIHQCEKPASKITRLYATHKKKKTFTQRIKKLVLRLMLLNLPVLCGVL